MVIETWCDKLASTPAIGFQYDSPHYVGSDTVLTSLSPILDKWTTLTKSDFSITNHESFNVNIQRENGFLYQFDPFKCSVTFQHQMKLRPTSGGLPVAEFASEPLPFTRSLDIATDELVEVALLLSNKSKDRSIKRIGVVSTTVVSEMELPPGVKRFIDYASRPWTGALEGYSYTVIAKLRETDLYETRCIHSITKPDDPDQLMTIRFDWQKVLSKPVPLIRDAVEKEIASVKNSALEYLEKLAEGNVFDEHII
jgi:hypothetical protein